MDKDLGEILTKNGEVEKDLCFIPVKTPHGKILYFPEGLFPSSKEVFEEEIDLEEIPSFLYME